MNNITEIIIEEASTASATTAEDHTGQETYEADGAQLGFQPASDEDLILLSEDLTEIFETQARDAEDPVMLAAVLFSDLRCTVLALEQLEGVRPLDLRRGEPRSAQLMSFSEVDCTECPESYALNLNTCRSNVLRDTADLACKFSGVRSSR